MIQFEVNLKILSSTKQSGASNIYKRRDRRMMMGYKKPPTTSPSLLPWLVTIPMLSISTIENDSSLQYDGITTAGFE